MAKLTRFAATLFGALLCAPAAMAQQAPNYDKVVWKSLPVVSGSHAAGYSVGGLFTMALPRTAGGSAPNGGEGAITVVGVRSTAGNTAGYQVYLFNAKPSSASGCQDNAMFTLAAADALNLIGTSPITLTGAVPSTVDTASYAYLSGIYFSYNNTDSPGTANVYGCIVAAATDTTDPGSTIALGLSGPQD